MKIHDYSADSAECLGFIGQGEGIPIPDWETSMDALKELGVNALNFKCFAKPPAETPNEGEVYDNQTITTQKGAM